jgi:hypothetical protein
MNEELDEDIINVVQRWEAVGLLDGLPILEKTELALIYDNATRLLLSELTLSRIPKKITDTMDSVIFPICRRLYKRVGPRFDLEQMLSSLLESVKNNIDGILSPETKEKNPIVDFCVNFADTYEDETTSKNNLSDEEYEEKINNLLSTMKEILLNRSMVSYVNKENDSHKLTLSKTNRSINQTRFWNQSISKNFLNSFLSEINKGL